MSLRTIDVSSKMEKKGKFSQSDLKHVYHYDPATGAFKWNNPPYRNVKSGEIVKGSVSRYVKMRLHGKSYQAHRLAWLYVYGEMPDGYIDHINRDRKDNRISNLRVVTAAQNNRNMPISSRNKVGISGVRWEENRGKWKVAVCNDDRQVTVGRFLCLLDAVAARFRAYREFGYSETHGLKEAL